MSYVNPASGEVYQREGGPLPHPLPAAGGRLAPRAGVPRVYQIETTSACNLKCSFCPLFADWYDKAPGFMNPDLIDRIDWSNTSYAELQFSGEPTLHKRLGEIIDRLHQEEVLVGFSTNGTFMDRLAAVIDRVDILTVNDDDYRDPIYEERPNVFVQQLGVNYPIEDYSRTVVVEPHPGSVCTTPIDYVSIHWNGDVVPCCKDHSGVHVFGNLWEQTFEEIVFGAKRRAFLEAMSKANGLCEFCCAPNPHRIHKKLLRLLPAAKENHDA